MGEVTIRAKPHTALSPSMLGRVEACTASHFLTPSVLERDASEASAYGTVCHAVAERLLNDRDMLPVELIGEVYEADGYSFIVDESMLDVIDPYVDYVKTLFTDYRSVQLEQRLLLPEAMTIGLPKIAGLLDCCAQDDDPDKPIVVVDLKSGRQPVSPRSVQLGLYGLMALNAPSYLGSKRGPQRQPLPNRILAERKGIPLRTVVVQPRSEGPAVESHDWSWAEISLFTERMERLFDELRHYRFRYGVGDHCQFCPVAGACPHLRAVAMDAALARVVPDPELVLRGEFSMQDLDDALSIIPILDNWKNAVLRLTESYLREGGVLTNAQLSKKRAVRRWKDDADPVALLKKHGVEPYEKTLLSPAKAEKALPKGVRWQVNGMAEKPDTGLTVVVGETKRTGVRITETLQRAVENAQAARILQRFQSEPERKDSQTIEGKTS